MRSRLCVGPSSWYYLRIPSKSIETATDGGWGMEEQSSEKRLAALIDAVKKASATDASLGIGRTHSGDALDQLADAIENLLQRSRESVIAFQLAREAMLKLQTT